MGGESRSMFLGAQSPQGEARRRITVAPKLCLNGTPQGGFVQEQPRGVQSMDRGHRDTVQPPGSGWQTWKVRVARPRSGAQQAFELGVMRGAAD